MSKTSPAFRGYIVNEQWDTTFDANTWVVELTAPGTADITTYEGRTVLYQTSGLDGDSTVKRTFDIGYYRTRFTACRMKAVIKVINGGYIDGSNLSLLVSTQKAGFLLAFVNDRIQYQSDEPGFPWKYYLMDTRDDFHTYEIVMKENGKADVLVDDKLIWKDAVSTYGAANLIWFRATDGPDWYVDSAEYWYVHDTEIYWSRDGKEWRDVTLEVSEWELDLSVSRGANTLSLRFPAPWDRNYELRNTYLRLFRKGERAFHGRVNTYRKSFPENILELEATEESVGFKQCIVVSKEYEDKELSAIVKDIIDYYNAQQGTAITKTNVATTNIIIHRAVFNEQSVFDILSHLAEICSYDWYLDAYNDFHFFRRKAEDAGIHLKDGESILSARFEDDYEQVKTRVIVKGALGRKQGLDFPLCFRERTFTKDYEGMVGTAAWYNFDSTKGRQRISNTFKPLCSAVRAIRLFPRSYDTTNPPTADFKLTLEEKHMEAPEPDDSLAIFSINVPSSNIIERAGMGEEFSLWDATTWSVAPGAAALDKAQAKHEGIGTRGVKLISASWHELFDEAPTAPKWTAPTGFQNWIFDSATGWDFGSTSCGQLVDHVNPTNVYSIHDFGAVEGTGRLVFLMTNTPINDGIVGVVDAAVVWVENADGSRGIGIGYNQGTMKPEGTDYYFTRFAWDGTTTYRQATTVKIWERTAYWKTPLRLIEFKISSSKTEIFIDGIDVSFTDGNETLVNGTNFQRITLKGQNNADGLTNQQYVYLDHMLWLRDGESTTNRYIYQTLATPANLTKAGLFQIEVIGCFTSSLLANAFQIQLVNRGLPSMRQGFPSPRAEFYNDAERGACRQYYWEIGHLHRDKVSELRFYAPLMRPYIICLMDVKQPYELVIPAVNIEALDLDKEYAISLEADLDQGWVNFYLLPSAENKMWELDNELNEMQESALKDYFTPYGMMFTETVIPFDAVVEVNDLEAQVSKTTEYGIKEISFEDPLLIDEFDAKLLAINKLKSLVVPRTIGDLEVRSDFADYDLCGKVITVTVSTLGIFSDKFRVGQTVLRGSSKGVFTSLKLAEHVEFAEQDLAAQLKVIMDKVKGKEISAEMPDVMKLRYWTIMDLDTLEGLTFENLTAEQYGIEKEVVKYSVGSLRCDHQGSTLAPRVSGFYKTLTTQDWSAFTLIELWTYFPSAELHDLTLSDFEFKCVIKDAASVTREWRWNATVTDKWEKILLSMKDVTSEGAGFDITQIKEIWLGVTVAQEPYSDWEHTIYYDQVMGLATENPDIAQLPIEIST